MKVSRETKSAINRRAYFVAQEATARWAARMREAIEAGEMKPHEVETWWPEELEAGAGIPVEEGAAVKWLR